ncbi:iron-sulfur cluster assembly protein [Flavobacterium sp. PL11]|jgi:iron-sulfur cluster assembly protein|nr:iron-sulfur cluster assembly protein [Flavobacterium sp. PL11]
MITVSENAKQHLLRLIANENSPEGTFIRVGVDVGGCSGLTYKLPFNHIITQTDTIFEDKGIQIAVDKKSFLYLIKTELD